MTADAGLDVREGCRSRQSRRTRAFAQIIDVELRGLEPLTPTLPVWCATSCATAPSCPDRVPIGCGAT